MLSLDDRNTDYRHIMTLTIIVAFVGGVLLGVALILNARRNADDVHAASTMEERTTRVEPGDSLWSIASREFPGEHTGKRVHKIRQLNPEIDPGRLQIGQIVRLP